MGKKIYQKSLEKLSNGVNDLELIFSMLGEKATTEITRDKNSKGIPKLKIDANKGGKIAGDARKKLEKELGRPVISKKNYLKGGDKIKQIKN